MSRPEPRMDTHDEVFGARIFAFIIDSVIVGIITFALLFVFTILGVGIGSEAAILFAFFIAILVGFVLQFAYFIYFEGNSGQTPGKRLMDIMVVKEDGTDCDYGSSAIRNVLRIVDAIGIVIPYLVGLIVIFLTDEDQRVGDIVADTLVVRTQ